MSLINITNLTFSYPGSYDNVFQNISLQLDTRWHLGLIGRNGRGKTTLLRLLMGDYQYSGTITASTGFSYFPYTITSANTSCMDAVLQIAPSALEWQVRRELSLLDVDPAILTRQYNTLSRGEQTKLQLTALFLSPNNFLLIDEPTNHLDLKGRQVVAQYLKLKSGFILVSHDRTFLDSCIDHTLSINRNGITIEQGNFVTWQQNKDSQDRFELAENHKLKGQIAHLAAAAKQSAGWSNALEATKNGTKNSGLRPDRGYIGHKAAKMMKRAKSAENRRQRAVEEKSTLLKNIEEVESLKLHPLKHFASELVVFHNVCASYNKEAVVRGISFTINQGERTALLGKNGSGKSTILKLILGQDIEHSGTIRLASGLKISYVSQDTTDLSGTLYEYAESVGLDLSLFLAILRKMDFQRIQFEKPITDFSQGQKKKVLIAASLCQQAHLYIWDEPLNYIDLLSRLQIEELILEYSPTLLFVEHDSAFARNIATNTITL